MMKYITHISFNISFNLHVCPSFELPVLEAKVQSAHNSARSARSGHSFSERKTAGYHSGRNSQQASPRGSIHLGSGKKKILLDCIQYIFISTLLTYATPLDSKNE